MIRQWNARRLGMAALLLLAVLPARGQEPAPPPALGLDDSVILAPPPRPGTAPPPVPTPLPRPSAAAATGGSPATTPAEARDTEPKPSPWLRQGRLDFTWIPGGGGRGFGVNNAELSATFALPAPEGWAPLLLTPGFAARFWAAPQSEALPGHPDLPPRVYDLSLDVGWRPQLARWFFADVGVTPGLYTDFHRVESESFRPHARALGIVAFSPQWQVVAGVLYVNRLHTKILPAGGVIWRPGEDTRCELVFPQPKISQRLTTIGLTQWWGYVAGEFGGGTWTVERAGGAPDLADYTDLRLLLGLEWVQAGGLKGHVEVGYVFRREVRYSSATPEFTPGSTVMLRAGVGF